MGGRELAYFNVGFMGGRGGYRCEGEDFLLVSFLPPGSISVHFRLVPFFLSFFGNVGFLFFYL